MVVLRDLPSYFIPLSNLHLAMTIRHFWLFMCLYPSLWFRLLFNLTKLWCSLSLPEEDSVILSSMAVLLGDAFWNPISMKNFHTRGMYSSKELLRKLIRIARSWLNLYSTLLVTPNPCDHHWLGISHVASRQLIWEFFREKKDFWVTESTHICNFSQWCYC